MSGVGGSTFVLTSADLAEPVPIPVGAELARVAVVLATPGSTTSTVTVKKNGTDAVAVDVDAGKTVGLKAIENPYVGINTGVSDWSSQEATPYDGVSGSVPNIPPLASFDPGDTVSVSVSLGTDAANESIALFFVVR